MGRLRGIAIDVRPLRVAPAFRRLWIGQSISQLGSSVTMVAVPYQLYQLTHSTLMLGLLGLCSLAPLLVAPLVGGAIADAVDRRKLILWSEVALAVTSGLFAVNAALAHPQVWALFVLETVATVFGGFGWPALRSAIPRLVPPDQVTAAAALQSLQGNTARVAGPALGGLLIAGIGVTGTFVVDAASFAASILAVVALPAIAPLAGSERPSLATVVEGFRFVRSQKAVLGIFMLDTNAMIFGMPRALFPAIALHRLGGDATILGLLYAAPNVGALAATLFSGWLHRVRRMGVGVAVSAAAWGAAVVAFGVSRSLWPALVALAAAGGADMVSAVLRSTMVIDATPDAMRGRVAGIELMQVASAPALGDVEAGALASVTSVRFSVVTGGLACIAGSLLIALAVPALARYDAHRTRAERIAREGAADEAVPA
jgi:MFS family permease